jgi:hypothetical protein
MYDVCTECLCCAKNVVSVGTVTIYYLKILIG